MEKFSKWRDPATGIQPFLPPIASGSVNPLFKIILYPLSAVHSLGRGLVLAVVCLLHVLLVDGVCLILAPVPHLRRFVAGLFTSFTCRLALALMGYWWIETDLVSPKRGKQTAIAQAVRSPMKGDLIIANWSSYVDVLYLAFRYNPTFVLPVFSPVSMATRGSTGRHTGTGSANINNALPQPPLLGYVGVPLLAMLAKTGSLPETHSTPPRSLFKTLKDARMKCAGPVILFPEATTGNGRAVLRFAEGTLLEQDIGTEGITWITYLRHSAPEAFAPSATCPLPQPLRHLLTSVLFTPTPIPRRSLTVRTLHPSASPSSPSFLPSEILANAPGGLEGAGKDGTGAWREAIATVLAETGRVRRVKGMGWVEKGAFLEYWNGRKRRRCITLSTCRHRPLQEVRRGVTEWLLVHQISACCTGLVASLKFKLVLVGHKIQRSI